LESIYNLLKIVQCDFKTRSSAMTVGLRNTLVIIEKSLQSMNDLDTTYIITVTAIKWLYGYYFLFVDCCFNVFI